MPRAVVRWYSSTTTWPSSVTSTPASFASSRSPLGIRPVATSTTSACTVEPSSSSSVDSGRVGAAAGDVAVAADLPLARGDVGEALADVVVAVRQQRRAAQDDRHAGAQRGEHVRELRGDETAADDHQVLGHLGDAHDGVAGVDLNPAVGDRRRNHRPRPGRDHHLIGRELVARLGAQHVAPVGPGRAEAGVAVEHRDVGGGPAVPFARRGRSGRCGRTPARRCRPSARRRGGRRPRTVSNHALSQRLRRRRRTSWSECSRRSGRCRRTCPVRRWPPSWPSYRSSRMLLPDPCR